MAVDLPLAGQAGCGRKRLTVTALNTTRLALSGSILGYAGVMLLSPVGWLDGGAGLLTGIVFAVAIGVSAVACVIAQWPSSRNRKKPSA